jgi:hypothetical protein
VCVRNLQNISLQEKTGSKLFQKLMPVFLFLQEATYIHPTLLT